jgi:arylsulfatase A-like enzyme
LISLVRLVLAMVLLLLLAPAASAQQPNFVFVLADDFSSDLLPYMPNVQAMQREGTSFERYIVTDSLCCPSRASILTGRYPHSTGVRTNVLPFGGFDVFHITEEWSTIGTSLQQAGYRTALMGKYLNGYAPRKKVDGQRNFVPPGWSAWAGVPTGGDPDFNYTMLVKGVTTPARVVRYGRRPSAYLTDVLSRRGRSFIAGAVKAGQPFMLKLSPYAPHYPYTPAPRDAKRFPGLKAPRGELFDAPQLEGSPVWLTPRKLARWQVDDIDAVFRKRAQSVVAIDRMVAAVRTQLRRLGVADNTYIVFTSDNGFHTGQRRMLPGKQTYWDHDIRVPLIVVGPGVPAGASVPLLAANIDLRPTFQELAGAPIGPRVEGRSLAPFLRGQAPPSWRRVTLVEHRGPNWADNDPDAQRARQGNPPSYAALRFADALYVQYDNPTIPPEYYDHASDPLEQRNVYGSLTPERQAELAELIGRLKVCNGGPACQAADAQ